MNEPMAMANPVTMTSQEIAVLTGKAHRNVTRDIRGMLVQLHGEGGVLRFEHTQRNPQNNQPYTVFRLPRREVEILLTGYSVPLRARVIDRLHELELALTPAVPRSLPEALRLAADLAAQVEAQAPKVAALERLSVAEGTMCLTDAAKHLGARRQDLLAYLQANRWIYRRTNSARWIAYQPRLAAGLPVHKTSVVGRDDDCADRIASQVRVTPRGLALLAERLEMAS